MTNAEIKQYLNKTVYFRGVPYILKGATIRKNNGSYEYDAELQDVNAHRSLLITRLEVVDAKLEE